MDKIKVVVQGALGRMGQEVIRALCQDDTTVAVGAVDLKVAGKEMALPDGSSTIPLSANLKQLLDECRTSTRSPARCAGRSSRRSRFPPARCTRRFHSRPGDHACRAHRRKIRS